MSTIRPDVRRPALAVVDQVAIICGHYTDTATGVSAELEIAREERKPYFGVSGRVVGDVAA